MANISVPRAGTSFIVSSFAFKEGSSAKSSKNIVFDVVEVLEYSTDLDVFYIKADGFFECYIKQNKYTKTWYIYDITTPIAIEQEEMKKEESS